MQIFQKLGLQALNSHKFFDKHLASFTAIFIILQTRTLRF